MEHKGTKPQPNHIGVRGIRDHRGEVELEEESQTGSVSTSRLWKLRWQLQAAQTRAALVPSSPDAMNSRQPSTAYPPMLAAWFFLHSLYLTTFSFLGAEPLESFLGAW